MNNIASLNNTFILGSVSRNILWDAYAGVFKLKKFISDLFPKTCDTIAPPPLQKKRITSFHPPLKTGKYTFDQRYQYLLEKGEIYFKPLNAKYLTLWTKIPFHRTATRITADGDRLAVFDENNQVFYAHTDSLDDKMTLPLKWRKNWFGLSGIARVVNYLKPSALHTMEKARAVAISHQDKQAPHYTDRQGEKHSHPLVGGTSLYMLNPTGTRIFFADPRLPNKFQNEITGPDNGRFMAETMDASGSTLFLMQRGKNAKGEEIQKMYTRHVDLDSMGNNPLLSSKKNQQSLALEDWKEQPCIRLKGKAHLTKEITISQTGKDLSDRLLRVEGTDSKGNTGYYVKKIDAKRWEFKETDHRISREAFLSRKTPRNGLQKGPKIVQDYEGKITIGNKTVNAVLKNFSATNFTEKGLHTEISIPSENITYSLQAKKGMRHILGITTKHAHGILTALPQKPGSLQNHSVGISKEGSEIIIKGKNFHAVFSGNKKKIAPPQKLSLPTRYVLGGLLFILHGIKFILKVCSRLADRLLSNRATIKAQERLFHSLRLGDAEDTQIVLKRLIAKDPSLAPKILIDFLSKPSVSKHLKKMMEGANTLVRGKKADDLFRQLTQLPGASQRPSSHPHQKGTCFGFECPLFGELLFWKDDRGALRVQFEANSLKSLLKIFCHTVDFFKYKLHNRQQGLYGSSKHTDEFPLIVTI